MSDKTIFDKIIAKEMPADVVYEDDNVLAINDINPIAPTHILVIPKAKAASLDDLDAISDAQVVALMRAIPRVAKAAGLSRSGYRVVVNNGRDGQQTVDYLHVHILGGRAFGWPPG